MNTSTDASATRLLWTGGWDSTFRLLNLLLVEHRVVQPYYIIDKLNFRPAVPAEQQAMRRIRQLMQTRYPEASARLGPSVECAVDDIAPDERLTEHFEQCLKRGFIGGQYEWLARFCAEHGIDEMELAIHRDDKARELLSDLIDASRKRLDTRFAGDSRYELFRFFGFPLFDTTKREMRAESRDAGFEDFMKLTWFCHRPRSDRPCGTCNPCIYTIEEGLGDRVPLAGRIRYSLRVLPRIRRSLAHHPALYLRVRALYRRVRALRQRSAASSA